MRPVNQIATAALALIAVLTLGACDSKKTSAAATTSAQACIANPAYPGTYTYAGTVTPCNPTAQANTLCPATGIATLPTGQTIQCTPGQYIQGGNGYTYPGQYPYPNYQNQGGCDQWTYQYGVPYVPVIVQGQLQCMRSDLYNQYAQGTPYYNNYDYAYAYPPYSYDQGGQQCLSFGYGNIGAGYCW